MLKKYTLFFKKQFKHRWVRPSFLWESYYYSNFWYLRTPQQYFYRGYSRFAITTKLHFYRLLFKFIKKRFRSRKILFFVTCKVNRMLSKKNKNSRMGKGVGKRFKWVFFFEPYYPLFIAYNCNISRLKWISNFLWKHMKIKIFWAPTYFSLHKGSSYKMI